jgi:hypothetical protein
MLSHPGTYIDKLLGKFRLITDHKGPEVDARGWSMLLYPRERLGTQCKGGYVGPRVRKISPLQGFDSRTVQPVTGRYTD